MGPVWRLIRGQKDQCHRCGKEILDFPAVGPRGGLPVPSRGEVLLGVLPLRPALRGRHRARVAGAVPAGDQARDPVSGTGRPSRGSELAPLAEKVLAGERLSFEDGVAPLPLTRDFLGLGRLANHVREERHGNLRLLQREPLSEPDEPLLGGLRALRLGQEGERAGRLRDGDRRVRRGGGQGLQRGGHGVPHRRGPPSDLALRATTPGS